MTTLLEVGNNPPTAKWGEMDAELNDPNPATRKHGVARIDSFCHVSLCGEAFPMKTEVHQMAVLVARHMVQNANDDVKAALLKSESTVLSVLKLCGGDDVVKQYDELKQSLNK